MEDKSQIDEIAKEFESSITHDQLDKIKSLSETFASLTVNHTCENAKKESKKERYDMEDVNDNNFTYGEIDCETLLQCFCFIENQYEGLDTR